MADNGVAIFEEILTCAVRTVYRRYTYVSPLNGVHRSFLKNTYFIRSINSVYLLCIQSIKDVNNVITK